MKTTCSLALLLAAGALISTNSSLRAADTTSEGAASPTAIGAENTGSKPDEPQVRLDYYRSCELSLEGFGTGSLGQYTIDHLSGARVRHNARLGAGVGLSYFFTRNLGIGAECYSENTSGVFIDSASANLILRLPLAESGFAPYVFGGGGRQFDMARASFCQAGVGLEYRFNPHMGVFLDARGVLPDETKYYGVARLGVRFAF